MAHRSSPFTEELASQLVGYIAAGLYVSTACDMCKISRKTFYEWKRRGREGEERFVDFFERIKEAEGKTEARLSTHIERAAPDDWKAAAWKLERRFPGKYAKHTVNRIVAMSEVEELLDRISDMVSPEAHEELVDAVAKLMVDTE